MKNFRLLGYLFALSLFIYSCDSSRDERPLGEYEKGLLIINEGNFSSRDGDISHYNFNTGDVQQNIFEKVNNRPFAGLVQDVVEFEDYYYLVSNTGKVEIVNKNTFQSLGSVGGNTVDDNDPELNIPRSAIVADNKIYIADWGPYDATFANPKSYVAIVNNLSGGDVFKKSRTSSRPENFHKINNDLLIVCSAARKIDVMRIGIDTVNRSIDVEGTPVRFIEHDNKLLLFSRSSSGIFFHEINKTDYSITNSTEINISNTTSKLTLGENGEAYIITSTGWPDYNDAVSKISITSGQVLDASFYEGNGFYGIGFDNFDKNIYLSENNGFQGSGTAIVINQSGAEVKTIPTGVGPSGFIFRR
ncbi:surface layer protein [Belliella sp. DSM 107340]|uniref:Surface layer protein n=1 Tax=Belliella calami TaxID=2923436 RepID=A0ABS9USG6_9BACT|nr:surface layer protein [Belliella calami]MCH7399571.1 surface layer protein [Belliella calami]